MPLCFLTSSCHFSLFPFPYVLYSECIVRYEQQEYLKRIDLCILFKTTDNISSGDGGRSVQVSGCPRSGPRLGPRHCVATDAGPLRVPRRGRPPTWQLSACCDQDPRGQELPGAFGVLSGRAVPCTPAAEPRLTDKLFPPRRGAGEGQDSVLPGPAPLKTP